MSRDGVSLRAGSTSGPSGDERPSSRAVETCSFADLIRAREEQQRRIREALEEQNRQLRARLVSEETTQGGGESAIAAAAVRRRSSQSPAKPQGVPIEEFVNFVTEMKDLINRAQQADLVAFHALQDRVEFQNRALMQRVAELEAQMIAMQRREEFGPTAGDSPCMPMTGSDVHMDDEKPALQYVLHELDKMRHTAEEAMQRVRQHDEVLDRHQTSFRLLEKDLNALETKMVDLESLPSLFRRESMTLEERYAEFTRRVQEGTAQQREKSPRSFEDINGALRLLEEKVQVVGRAVVEMNQRNTVKFDGHAVGDVEQFVSNLAGGEMQELDEANENFPWAALKELRLTQSAGGADGPTLSAGEGGPVASKGRNDVAAAFMGGLAKRLQDFEAKLQAAATDHPTGASSIEGDRIDLLTKEVEGATVMLEGAIARRANLGLDTTISDTKQFVERVARVEAQVGILEEKLNYFADKLEGSCTEPETHTGDSTAKADGVIPSVPVVRVNSDPLDTPAKGPHEHINRYLKEELELAAVGLRNEAAGQLGMGCNTAVSASPNGIHVMDGNILLHSSPGRAPVLPAHGKTRGACEEPETFLFGPFKAPSVPLTSQSLSKAVAEINERRRQKEDAVREVIVALRDVQQRFSELSDRESAAQRGGTRRRGQEHTTPGTREDPVCLLESIASQKEAIYSKEKQLLNLRNTLWREIAQLEEDERELLAS